MLIHQHTQQRIFSGWVLSDGCKQGWFSTLLPGDVKIVFKSRKKRTTNALVTIYFSDSWNFEAIFVLKSKNDSHSFWTEKRILLFDCMQHGITTTADSHFKTLNRISQPVQNKLRQKLSSGVTVLHNNDRPHMAAKDFR